MSEERIAELEKKNAKLEMALAVEQKNKTNVLAELNDETAQSNVIFMDKLSRAKDIIQEFCKIMPSIDNELLKVAKHFLED